MTHAASPHSAAGMHGATRFLRDMLDALERDARAAARAARGGGAPEDAATAGEAAPDQAPATASLGDVMDRLDERAFGFLLLLLALPCCLPFVYVLPQIVALPMLALAGQLAAGRQHPWLPKRLRARRFSIPAFRAVVERSAGYARWVERLARPRLAAVTGRLGLRLVGALMIAPCLSILTPLPSTNTVPGIGVAIAALGLIERDGALVILGLVIGFLWVALLLTLGVEAASLIMGWISARL
ncbi:exopolysaccharide biosynthesis protein [Amphiplicatus metriothermophilus]|nr:exopolysaccharide biosynthesis protein [Amphiplicatus metriothermophilus]MBB5517724.1 hypothetical protein [Amphiplicatus metriothermophilus]